MPPGTPPVLRRAESPTNTFHPGQGSVDPSDVNMQVILAVVAGVAGSFVLASIWFFFRAKNGGFVWREGDWEDYKSTVLRRKGPDGKTLSNATKSTDLGGGSIVPGRSRSGGYTDYDGDDVTRTMTREDGGTYATTEAGMTEKQRRKKRDRIREKFRRKKHTETWEGQNDDDVRAYRHEKPARVGGLNREADGTYHDGSTEHTRTNPEMTEVSHSDLGDGFGRYDDYPEHGGGGGRGDGYERRRESRPQQRNFSFTPGEDDTISNVTEQQPLRGEADEADSPPRRQTRRHQHQSSRNSQRPRGPRSGNTSPRKQDRRSMPGGYASPLDMSSTNGSDYQYEQVGNSDAGTGNRSYHHPIPALTKGYRRGAGGQGRRRDSLSDSDEDR